LKTIPKVGAKWKFWPKLWPNDYLRLFFY